MDNFEIKESINREALRYIAGYVAFKFKSKYNLGTPSSQFRLSTKHAPDWIDFVSIGSLLYNPVMNYSTQPLSWNQNFLQCMAHL